MDVTFRSKDASFGLYLIGCVIFISGLVYGAVILHTNTLDRSRRNRVGGACDLDGRQSHAPKGSERPVRRGLHL